METLFTNRKAQTTQGINGISGLVFAILIGTIILGLGGTILAKIQDTQSDNTATTENNDSFSWPGNNTNTVLTQSTIITSSAAAYCNVTKLGVDVNFTMTNGGIIILNQTAGGNGTQFASCAFNVSYSYKIGSAARNTSTFGLTGVDTFAGFIPTIAIVAISAIVIGIILLFFGRRREGQ